ncbi:MAG TPA: GreA/GreB family elongation factor [Thermoanaerobaculia bacterium]|nr:GreA/GreB family elongation factor [Thermoanaerobaculia bacterium]
MTGGASLQSLLTEKRFDLVETVLQEALADPLLNEETILAALRGLARAGQKPRLQALAGAADAALKKSRDPDAPRLRWTILKEAVRAGATPSTPDGFHRLFEDVLAAAWPDAASLASLLGRFKFREAKDPLDGLARAEKAEAWLPFETGKVFAMAGRGAGKVVETNFALNVVRLDFEAAKGVAVPIGIASRQLVPLPPGHFLNEKFTAPDALRERVVADPGAALKHLIDSFGRALTMTEVKEAVKGLVAEDAWTSWWTASKKNPQVVVHGSGKNATVEWSDSADAADATLLAKFERSALKDRIDLFRKNQRRSADLALSMAKLLVRDAEELEDRDSATAFEIAVLVEKVPGVDHATDVERHVLAQPLALLGRLSDRSIRERALEILVREKPAEAPGVLAEWMFKEEDGRTIELIDRKLAEIDPATRERTLDKLLKNPRSGPRAFVWFAQRSATDDAFRARLNPNVLGRLLDAISWDELGGLRTKVREMFDRTGLVAGWLVKQASVEEARTFLAGLSRHHELEPLRRDGLLAAAEMRFKDLRKAEDDTFFVTAEAIERKRAELDDILKVQIPENTKGIALAAAEGDLSENFEYKARRDKQQLLSARAGKIQEELGKARALDPATIDTTEIRPGSRVTLEGPKGKKTVTLLGPWDSKPDEGVYSYLSELGKLLLGKAVGEQATVLGDEMTIKKIEVFV